MSRNILQKNISRLMAALLALMLLLSIVPAVSANSGSCGNSLTWSLEAGTLTISGSGDMADYADLETIPWYEQRNDIYKLVLPEGMTSVGYSAFYGCTNLTTVTIPDSVAAIDDYAFYGCTGMTMLRLGSGVKTIGEGAFSNCVALAGLTLPGSLQSIGKEAFYRCESIPAVTIPASVTSVGILAFAYCKGLVRADIQANITVVPEWMFYSCERLAAVSLPPAAQDFSTYAFRGCTQLTSVYYEGTGKSQEEIQEIIAAGNEDFGKIGGVSSGTMKDEVIAGEVGTNPDGGATLGSTTVNTGSNATVSTTITTTYPKDDYTQGNSKADITVNIENADGWKEAGDIINEALKDMNESAAVSGGTSDKTHIQVFVKGSDSIDQSFINSFIGRDVELTITTQDGSVWKLDGNTLEEQTANEDGETIGYDLRFEVTPGSAELCEELGVATCYTLKFLAPAQINAQVLIRLDSTAIRQKATLMQRTKGNMVQIQTVIVDGEGYAHFYLAAVDDETEYCIAINLPQPETEAIIPQPLMEEYGVEQIAPMEYEITGRTSSWGMNINQVTWIMVGVLGGAVVIVGIVMFALNKRKLKHGYVPDWDEDDE